MPKLPVSFLRAPFAHRALHDIDKGRPENSRAAVSAAAQKGYGIEIDVQLSSDGQAMVFHDYSLERLTLGTGAVRQAPACVLAETPLRHGEEGVPELREVLDIVAGQVPLLIEVKDQDGALGASVGLLEGAVVDALEGYEGDVALMSFNPNSVAVMRDLAPNIPRGLVTEDFLKADDWVVPAARLQELNNIPDYDRVEACFVSHNHAHFPSKPVQDLKSRGANILCWTVKTPEEERHARLIAENVTFEGYLAEIPS